MDADRITRWLLRVVYCLAAAVIAAQVALWEEHRAQERYCQDRLAVLAAQCGEPLHGDRGLR